MGPKEKGKGMILDSFGYCMLNTKGKEGKGGKWAWRPYQGRLPRTSSCENLGPSDLSVFEKNKEKESKREERLSAGDRGQECGPFCKALPLLRAVPKYQGWHNLKNFGQSQYH